MTTHLDSFMDNNDVSYLDNFIIIYSNNVDDNFNDVMIEYDNEDGRLFIDEYFLKGFISWFPLDEEDSQEFIKDWFEETFKVKVSNTQS